MYHNELPDMSAAYKQVQEKNDGNLANNAPPYDKVTRRDVITGAKGKDEMGGKRKKHDCAKKVNYEGKEFDVIPEMHTMLEDGTVTHYDIEDAEYIYENVPVGDLEILISEKHEHFDNYDKNAEVLGEADSLAAMAARREKRLVAQRKKMGKTAGGHDFGHDYGATAAVRKKRQDDDYEAAMGRKPTPKKEAFAFSEADFAELETLGEEIDALTDEQLVDVMEDFILEMAQDDQDLIEICEHLEGVEMLSEEERDAGAMARAKLNKPAGPSRMDRLKSAAKKAGSKLKAGAKVAAAKAKPIAKSAAKGAVRGAGYAAGLAKRAAKSAKAEFKAGKSRGENGSSSSSKPAASSSSSSSDDDGTDGKLDGVLSSIRGSKGTSSGGGSSSASSGGGSKKKGPGLLRKVGSLVKKGLKKAVGKTSRLVSKGSDKLAKRLGEDYDQIAHLYESGLFSIEEIENVIEEGYKEIDQPKKNKMFRRAGNLSRDALQGGDKGTEAHKKSGKIVKQLNKLNQENK